MKQIQIIGNVGEKPTLQKLNDNIFSLKFSVAVSNSYKDKEGKEVEETDWFTCFRYFKTEPIELMKFFKKGLKVFVQGKPSFSVTNGKNVVYVNKTIQVSILEVLTLKKK